MSNVLEVITEEEQKFPWVAGFNAAFDADFKLDQITNPLLERKQHLRRDIVRDRAGVYACTPEREWVDVDNGKVSSCSFSHDFIADECGVDRNDFDVIKFMHGVNDYINTSIGEEVYV